MNSLYDKNLQSNMVNFTKFILSKTVLRGVTLILF